MRSNKGQIEIMGLLLIIILVAFGVLFALYFVLSPQDDDGSQQVKESIYASSTLTTLRKTSTDCHGRAVEELLQDCARTGGSIQCPSGGNTCQKADSTIDSIITEVFTESGRDYSFRVSGAPYFADIFYGFKECPGAREAKVQSIPVGVGYAITIHLDICA
jgi:hypothetical protein